MSSKLSKQTLEVAANVILINIDLRAHVISLRRLYCYYQSEEQCVHLLHVALYSIINLSESSQKICSLMHVRITMCDIGLVLCWELTGNLHFSQRTPANKSLSSCLVQRWRERSGILQEEDKSGCTPLAG